MKNTVVLLLAALLAGGFSTSTPAAQPAGTNPRVAELTRVVQSEASRKDKADACRQLAALGSPEAVPALVALLPDPELSHMARYGLEPIQSPAVDQAFRDALQTLQGPPLIGVIGSIGVRRDSKAVKPLSALLTARDPDVAQAAARSLGSIGTAAAAKALQKALTAAHPRTRLAFYEGLLRCADRLQPKSSGAALDIYEALSRQDVPHQVRAAALRGMIVVRGKRAVPVFEKALLSTDYTQFAAANRAALDLKLEPVTLALAGKLAALDAERKVVALQTLADLGNPATLPPVTGLINTGDKAVRLAAIRAAARFQSPRAADSLVGAMGDSDTEIARLALESYASIPGAEIDQAVLAMVQGSASRAVRLTGIELIARRGMTSGLPALYRAAADADDQVRAQGLRRIGELAGPGEIPALLALFKQAKTPADIEGSAQALGSVASRSGDSAATERVLVEALAGLSPAHKSALYNLLAALGGGAALKAVGAGLEDADPEVRAAALRALSSWPTAEAAGELLAVARSPRKPAEKTLALRGYFRLVQADQKPAGERLAMCREASALIESPEHKRLLLSALGSIRNPQAIELILPSLGDEALRDEAASAVLAIAEPLLRRAEGPAADRLAAPLKQVAESGASAPLVEKAGALLRQATAPK